MEWCLEIGFPWSDRTVFHGLIFDTPAFLRISASWDCCASEGSLWPPVRWIQQIPDNPLSVGRGLGFSGGQGGLRQLVCAWRAPLLLSLLISQKLKSKSSI